MKTRTWSILWLLALSAVLLLHLWFPPVGTGPNSNSYSATDAGKRVFYELLRERMQHQKITRNRGSLPSLVNELGANDALCLLGPIRYPTVREMEEIMLWVSIGGRLIIAGGVDDHRELEIPEVAIELIPNRTEHRMWREFNPRIVSIQSPIMESSDINWSTNYTINAASAQNLVMQDGKSQAVSTNYGRGKIVVVASDYIFSNRAMLHGDNSVLAFRLLEATEATGQIVVAESLNSSGTPKAVGLLIEPFFRPIAVQLLILILLFAWYESRRFGPFLPVLDAARQNIVRHTDTLGSLYFRANDGAVPLQNYLAQFKTELRIQHKRSMQRVLDPIAVRMRVGIGKLMRVITHAEKEAARPQLDRRSAARVIRRLALIRQAAKRRGQQKTAPADSGQ
ncbi:MAG: hypothetical protein CMJ78_21810 [Planctomycetaceae bacterium]|nr:hypothetical protein [Planctomycetaceae bacterium]